MSLRLYKFICLGIACILSLCFFAECVPAEQVNPFPRQVVSVETIMRWDFDQGNPGWQAVNDCTLEVRDGSLRICSTGNDPYLYGPQIVISGPFYVRLRVRTNIGGSKQIYYTTQEHSWSQERSVRYEVIKDNQWHTYEAKIDCSETITRLRLDTGSIPGVTEVESIEIIRKTLHPLEIIEVQHREDVLVVRIRNHTDQPKTIVCENKTYTVPAETTILVESKLCKSNVFEEKKIVIGCDGFPALTRKVFLYHPENRTNWVSAGTGAVMLKIASDGSGGRLEIHNRTAAILYPLACVGGAGCDLKIDKANSTSDRIVLTGAGVDMSLEVVGDEIHVERTSKRECEGPVVRVLGELEQGLLSGVEYLGKEERSSSTLDIETEEHLRYEPLVWHVTMPLMACVTDRAAIGVLWEDMTVQPLFAVPNFVDGSDDHRMALKGKHVHVTILVRSASLEDVILWAVLKRGLPELPVPPRSWEEQKKLCMAAFNGPLKTEKGWGHCVKAKSVRQFYSDHASTLWRLTGEIPILKKISYGGTHFHNDAIYFVTNRVKQWLKVKRQGVNHLISTQGVDGKFTYRGEYQKGHFEDTASGYCAQMAAQLLEFAWMTGDAKSLDAGIRTLEYMKRFHTPRGAQTWEISLHSPDILGSAWCVWSYVRGYQLTRKQEYLDLARKWAITGLPFIYQWSREPVMAYASIAVLGATRYNVNNWIGLPVQWCGLVYGYALLMLNEVDQTLDWRKIAEGITITAEQMQEAGGENIGCLPDSWVLQCQQGWGPYINPCTIVSMRLRLRGQIDSLDVAADEHYRVLSPFKVRIQDGYAQIEGDKDINYQILVNGKRIIEIKSQGHDIIQLKIKP